VDFAAQHAQVHSRGIFLGIVGRTYSRKGSGCGALEDALYVGRITELAFTALGWEEPRARQNAGSGALLNDLNALGRNTRTVSTSRRVGAGKNGRGAVGAQAGPGVNKKGAKYSRRLLFCEKRYFMFMMSRVGVGHHAGGV